MEIEQWTKKKYDLPFTLCKKMVLKSTIKKSMFKFVSL